MQTRSLLGLSPACREERGECPGPDKKPRWDAEKAVELEGVELEVEQLSWRELSVVERREFSPATREVRGGSLDIVGEFVGVVGKTGVKCRTRRKALDPPSRHSKPLPRWQRASETETPRVANPKPNESPPRGGQVTGPASRSLPVIPALRTLKA